jgi:hypothetical protein
MTRTIRAAALFLAPLVASLAFATVTPASAEPTVGGGIVSTNGKTTFGGLASLSIVDLPLVPLHVDATVESPFSNGGYAATIEARATPFGNELGAGVGFGNAGASGSTGVLYSAFIGHAVFPRTTLEAREYFGNNRRSSLFAGLRFSL